MADSVPQVFLVGAGPGNPGLLTLRAVECLGLADLVLYDQLVPTRLLDYAAASAERVCINDLPGVHPDKWPHIHDAMIAAARQGRRVVRLKGGDPFLFGRGGEEAESLRRAGIRFEIVPGVTSGLAAAVFSGIPLTHRAHSSAVAFVTGHENPTKPTTALDWPALAKFPGTLVFYMAIARLPLITQTLISHGKDAATPTAVVHWASTGDQQTVESTLTDLPRAVQAAGLSAPAIVIVGSVASLRPRLRWVEERPLFNKRVLVTRPKGQAGDLLRRLENLGAVPYLLPTVEIRELDDWTAVDAALARLADFDWLVFTSANGVHAFVKRLDQIGRDLRVLGPVKIAAIGSGTADALHGYRLRPDLVPTSFRSEGLAAALNDRVAGQRVLLARADRGRELLRDELAAVAEVEQIAVYSQTDAVDPDPELLDCIRRGEIDYITLTSSNIARALMRVLDEVSRQRIIAGSVKLVTISPVTSAAVRELGLPVAAESATDHTVAGLVEALLGLAAVDGNEQGGESEASPSHLMPDPALSS